MSTRFEGVPRSASLSLIPGALDGDGGGVLILRTDDHPEETVVTKTFFSGEDTTPRLRFRSFFGELYLEMRVLAADPGSREADMTLLLYRMVRGGPPVKVLEEYLELSQGRCGLFDAVALEAAPARPHELRVVVERKKRGAVASTQECRDMKVGVRSQTYALRDGCFHPTVLPLFFAPLLVRIGGAAPDCATSLCPVQSPGPWSTLDLVERDLHGPLVVTTPSEWVAVERSKMGSRESSIGLILDLAYACRVIFEVRPLRTPSRFIHSHWPYEIDELARFTAQDCCQRAKPSCAALPRAEPGDPRGPAVCERSVDRDARVCGDVSRYRSRDGSMIFDAIAQRVPQENGSSVALLAMLACDEERYGDVVHAFTTVVRSIKPESAGTGVDRR